MMMMMTALRGHHARPVSVEMMMVMMMMLIMMLMMMTALRSTTLGQFQLR